MNPVPPATPRWAGCAGYLAVTERPYSVRPAQPAQREGFGSYIPPAQALQSGDPPTGGQQPGATMNPCRWPAVLAIVLLGTGFGAAEDKKTDPIRPTETIKLFNGQDLTGFTTWLKDTKREDPKKVFGVQDGVIRVAGMPMGYLATDKAYQDYHLSLEWKWGK